MGWSISHTRETEGSPGAKRGGNANLKRGAQDIRCFAEGGAADGGTRSSRPSEVISGASSILWTEKGCHVPLMGTGGGDPAFRKSPYFIRRARQWRLEGPSFPMRTNPLRARNQGSSRPYGARHRVNSLGPSEIVTSRKVRKGHVRKSVLSKEHAAGFHPVEVSIVRAMHHCEVTRLNINQGRCAFRGNNRLSRG